MFSQPLTPAVRFLLIANLAAFLLRLIVESRAPRAFDTLFGLSVYFYKDFFLWQLITYMFLHAGIWHILFNMLILYFLGTEIERLLGAKSFLSIYLLSGMLGGLGWLLLSDGGICIGASGAVFGLLGAYVALFPNRYITVLIFFVLPVTMRAWVLAAILAGIDFFILTSRVESGIANAAHLAGLLAGYVFAFIVFRKGGLNIRIIRNGKIKNPMGLKVLKREDADGGASAEIDRILDKIANEGMQSLTRRERTVLEQASLNRRQR